MSTDRLPPFRPHRVHLMGQRDLGVVSARWVGCILELESGTRHGPAAVYEATPIKNPPPVVGMQVKLDTPVAPWRRVERVYPDGSVLLTGPWGLSSKEWMALDPSRIRVIKPMPEPEVGMRFKPRSSLAERSVAYIADGRVVLSNGTWMPKAEWHQMDPDEVLPGGSNYATNDDIPF